MVKSENSVMLTKEEFENLSKKWKPILSAMFEVATKITPEVTFPNDNEAREVYDKLAPLFSHLQNNAVELTIKMIKDEFFD